MTTANGAQPRTLMDYNLAGKGRRPTFFSDPAIDRVLSVVMTMAQELAVTRERLDTVERLLEKRGGLSRAEIEGFAPTEAERAERQAQRDEYVARLLRILEDMLNDELRGATDETYERTVDALNRS